MCVTDQELLGVVTRYILVIFMVTCSSKWGSRSSYPSYENKPVNMAIISRSTKDWSPSNYSQFWGVSLHDVVRGRLGAAWPSPPVSKSNK